MNFRLKIADNGNTTYTAWYIETSTNVTQAVVQARIDYPNSAISIQRQLAAPTGPPPTVPYSLTSDPNPTLGADLQLAGHKIVGQLENQTLLLDGGLI